ncbi:MAG: 5'-nucleotidase C-terminal domain-containing protein [Flavobacteriia bacterium]
MIFFLIGASLLACSSHLNVSGTKVPLNIDSNEKQEVSSFISPFKDSMDRAMNLILAESSISMEVGRPSSLLGNWASDALFVNQTRTVKLSEPIFCLLNTGGIRSSLGKGPVTLGDIFRIMPFENSVVWLRLPISSLEKIQYYLLQSGGEPISNASMMNGKLMVNGVSENTNYFWVITSDYLANGGDRMDFFQDAVERSDKKTLLRDVFIEEAKTQKNLIVSSEKRIQ